MLSPHVKLGGGVVEPTFWSQIEGRQIQMLWPDPHLRVEWEMGDVLTT